MLALYYHLARQLVRADSRNVAATIPQATQLQFNEPTLALDPCAL